MGLNIYVHRDASSRHDCTNGGVSSLFTRLCVVNIEGPDEPREDCPPVVLESHHKGCLRIVPAGQTGKWWMMGGNFGATSDSRFNEACARLLGRWGSTHGFYGAVAIHDRHESQDGGGA